MTEDTPVIEDVVDAPVDDTCGCEGACECEDAEEFIDLDFDEDDFDEEDDSEEDAE